MKINTTISERIAQMIEYLNVSTNDFAKKIGYNRSQAVYDVINGKSKPSFDFFEKLYNSEYSATFNSEWLIKGDGDMLKKVTEVKTAITSFDEKEKQLIEIQLKGLETENKLQSTTIELYKQLNDEMKFRIATLEKELKELKYTETDPSIHILVAEPAPELIKKDIK